MSISVIIQGFKSEIGQYNPITKEIVFKEVSFVPSSEPHPCLISNLPPVPEVVKDEVSKPKIEITNPKEDKIKDEVSKPKIEITNPKEDKEEDSDDDYSDESSEDELDEKIDDLIEKYKDTLARFNYFEYDDKMETD